MLRITELRLPLAHAQDALRPAIVARLGLRDADLTSFTVFKRSYDARKKTAIVLTYTVDCVLAVDESAVRARFAGDPHVRLSPDTNYRFVGQAADGFFEGASARLRPLVVGFGNDLVAHDWIRS